MRRRTFFNDAANTASYSNSLRTNPRRFASQLFLQRITSQIWSQPRITTRTKRFPPANPDRRTVQLNAEKQDETAFSRGQHQPKRYSARGEERVRNMTVLFLPSSENHANTAKTFRTNKREASTGVSTPNVKIRPRWSFFR